jgi:hypothetical protein
MSGLAAPPQPRRRHEAPGIQLRVLADANRHAPSVRSRGIHPPSRGLSPAVVNLTDLAGENRTLGIQL